MPNHEASGGPQAGSPFHAGEQAVQARAGVRALAERVGRAIIRDQVPGQHRELFEKLPYVLLSSLDAAGRPWASFVASVSGFIDVPDPRTLVIHARPLPGDVLSEQLEVGAQLGLLGIELHTRRRNRANGWLRAIGPDSFTLHVAQSFGNCPKHITPRAPRALVPRPLSVTSTGFEREGPRLSLRAQALIAEADTFFIASSAGTTSQNDARQGLDVSHRGGPTGFVSVEQTPAASVLSFLDYNGNNVFNTLGNITQNPRVGLTFVDFSEGHVLMLTGRARIEYELSERDKSEGGERKVLVEIEEGRFLAHVLPFVFAAV